MVKKVAVVTGSNKGLGFAIVKGLLKRFDGVVYLTSRDDGRGTEAVDELNILGLYPQYHQLDVVDRDSVLRFRDHIKKTEGGIDILINNAAVANNVEHDNTHEESKVIIDMNYCSIQIIQELLYPLVKNDGRILNISRDDGHISNLRNKQWIDTLLKKDCTEENVLEFLKCSIEGSKKETLKNEEFTNEDTIAANMITKVTSSAQTMLQQKQLASRNIAVNSLHPGFVGTNMTESVGFPDIDEAAKTSLNIVLDAPQNMNGAYIWHNGKDLDGYDHTVDLISNIASVLAYSIDQVFQK